MQRRNLAYVAIMGFAIIITAIGITFAYFFANLQGKGASKVKVSTSTLDSLIYNPGPALSLVATQQNFYENAGNLSTSSKGEINLKVNSNENATYCYSIELLINTNSFVYTTSDEKKEIIINVLKSVQGNEAYYILKDYDITDYLGKIMLPTQIDGSDFKHVISGSPEENIKNEIEATITFINLETNQEENTGKTLNANIIYSTITC